MSFKIVIYFFEFTTTSNAELLYNHDIRCVESYSHINQKALFPHFMFHFFSQPQLVSNTFPIYALQGIVTVP